MGLSTVSVYNQCDTRWLHPSARGHIGSWQVTRVVTIHLESLRRLSLVISGLANEMIGPSSDEKLFAESVYLLQHCAYASNLISL